MPAEIELIYQLLKSNDNNGVGSLEGLVGHYRNALCDWYGEVEDN